MSADPRAAPEPARLGIRAPPGGEQHPAREDDPTVVAAYEDLADAFEAYDAALYDAYGEMTPLDIYTGDEDRDDDEEGDEEDDHDHDELDDHDDEDGDDAQLYSGLDDDIEFEKRAAPPTRRRPAASAVLERHLVEGVHDLLGQLDRLRLQECAELHHRARADDRRGDPRPVPDPGEGDDRRSDPQPARSGEHRLDDPCGCGRRRAARRRPRTPPTPVASPP